MKETGVNRMKKFGAQFGNLLVLAATMLAMFIFFSIRSPYFLNITNMLNLLQQVCVLGIVSAGITLIILAGSLDLSV